MNTVKINTGCGGVTGLEMPEGYVFQGIPYATAERFEDPVLVESFEGDFDGTKKPLEFPQLNTYTDDSQRFYTKEFRRGETFEYAESPLTLNIMTPKNAEGCPVLIYIHGGGFFTGKQSEQPAGTSLEYAKRGIILVSVSYRLNVFGLYRSKNFFLKDQLAAVKWVERNISDFGGDPGNISLIGQSAGAMSVFRLLYTDALKGTVKRAIMMSGAGFLPFFADGYTEKGGKRFWDAVMQEAGCCSDEELKAVSTEKLWRAWWEAKQRKDNIHLLQPGIDGELIPCSQAEIKKSGRMLDIPLMVGVTGQDMIFSLYVFKMARDFAVWSCRRGREKVFCYYFDRVLPGKLYRSYHASDLWYMFGNMDKCWRPFGEDDYSLKDEMIDSVAKFIREDDPGWDAFTLKDKKFRRFNTEGKKYVKMKDCLGELIRCSVFERGPF